MSIQTEDTTNCEIEEEAFKIRFKIIRLAYISFFY